ncbi:N-acyl-D-amino-acid deacylase family protein [Haliangium ochraceum]|uniref:Amidohydrolase 3 n=1 Tax=Haliangium ochraceum (strain DSM 14365 / JCM 11303 / SMP-2) TaxID=502025 RepID=D0LHS2_HALO1|nr:amidohydrolase family protein [Haliangium ochraceum]ACY14751.1 Amidohydrolase 3 [Haliangium ochraceum DSM 14365]
MTYDLVITAGKIVDGTGGTAYRGDVAVKDGFIAEVSREPGSLRGSGERTIDAEGAIVTPGFIDIHTHYDGQVSWDDELAPSCFHGVTTCVMGNCGVGFAPVREDAHDSLISLMEGVEDIPGSVLSEGITWRWQDFPAYLDEVDRIPRTMDVCAQVPHDAVRLFIMGERGAAGEDATDLDVAAMRALCREALEAGAVGITTGRTDNHRTSEGRETPASVASRAELMGIASALDGLDHGVLQAVSDFDMADSPERFDPEFDLLEDMVRATGGHPMSMTLAERDAAPTQWRRILERVERATERGLPMHVQVAARGIGVILGLDATFHPFIGHPSYKALSQLPLAERVREMRTPELRARILSESPDRLAGDGSAIPPLVDQLLAQLTFVSTRLYPMSEVPDYEPRAQDSIFARAQARGVQPLEAVYDSLLEENGEALLYFPLFNYSQYDLNHLYEMITHPLALAGLSDGGAHVGTTCDASFPTSMLTHWVRDRSRGPRLPLERVVSMMTRRPARYIGLSDRGVVAPGCKADLNVIDLDALTLSRPRIHRDLPAGGKRFIQRAQGYRATIISGQRVLADGALTDARPGRLVRLGRAARNRAAAQGR